MNKIDTEVIKFALKQFPNLSDKQIATKYKVSPADVEALRSPPDITMKEAAKIYLKAIPLHEKFEKFKEMDIHDVWQMAEGKAPTTADRETSNPISGVEITVRK